MTVTRFRALVSTNWLRNQLFGSPASSKQALRVLDSSATPDPAVNGYSEFYQKSHIPQALYFSLHGLCPLSPTCLHKYPVPDANRFQDYAESLGISNDTHVVAYDRSNTIFALKTWWLFRLFGHTNVSVLDGGFTKWLMDGLEVSVEVPAVERSSFTPDYNSDLLRTFENMVKNLETAQEQVIDARSPKSFYSTKEEITPGKILGHIPGAKNIPYSSLFLEDGTFKPPAELKSVFDAVGVNLDQPLVASCETAMTACGLAAAAHILGKETVSVYNGSFREWSQRATADQIDVD